MKKLLSIFFCCIVALSSSQVLFSERFNTLALTSYTSGTVVCQYTNAPASFTLLNDGNANNIGSLNNLNIPFHVPSLKNSGWTTVYNPIEQDTFLVCTSWFDNTSLTADRWFITPAVSIGPKTIITWLAKSPDASFPDGYEVYGTDKTGTLSPSDFTIGDKLFSIADGNTTGGGEKNKWTRRSYFIGDIANGKTLRFAFRNNSKNMYQLWIDDIEVRNVSDTLDAAATSLSTSKYFKKGTTQTLKVAVSNNGATDLQNITINYKYGNSSVNTQSFVITPTLTALQGTVLEFPQKFNFTSAGYYEVKAWISLVNGSADNNLTNDTVRFYVTAQDTFPTKRVLVEQFSSANDGENPDAQEKAGGLQSANVIQVNIHANDSWTISGTSNFKNTYMKRTATALFDREYKEELEAFAVNRQHYLNKMYDGLSRTTPVDVSINNVFYFPGTGALSFQVSTKFYGEVKGDYRIGAYLVENHVCGNKNDTLADGRNQLSNYFNIPWSTFYQLGYYEPSVSCWVLDAWRFKQQNTLFHIFDGMEGAAGVIPMNGGTNNQIYSKNYFYTVPTSTYLNQYNPNNIYIVAYVAEYSGDSLKRNVLNVAKAKATTSAEVVGVREDVQADIDVMVYPNPASDKVWIGLEAKGDPVTFHVFDAMGKHVLSSFRSPNESISYLNTSSLEPGLYLLKVSTKNGTTSQKLMIAR